MADYATLLEMDPETPLGVLRRFGISTLEQSASSVVAEMPVGGMRNPFTGLPSIAALAILVDHVRPLGPAGATLLSVCTLRHRGVVIGGGTVRTMPLLGGPDGAPRRGDDPTRRTGDTLLATLMAVT